MSNVAQTILAQLGGNRFLAMTGAKDLVGGSDMLRLRLPRGAAKGGITHVGVRLDGNDEYMIEAGKYNAKRLEVVPVTRADGVQAAELRAAFTTITGLDTSL
jgi:hypothetical protein